MGRRLHQRAVSSAEREAVRRLAHARTASARAAERSQVVLLFCLAHPHWQFVAQSKFAACLNLIEPWGKVLCALALKGRRFESWAEIGQAVEQATAYWQAHKHPFIWGRLRRHRPRRLPGIALAPAVA